MKKPYESKYADGTSCMTFPAHTVGGDCVDWFDLADFTAWLDELRAEIPEAYRASARIQMQAMGDGESDREVQVSVCYWKPTEIPK